MLVEIIGALQLSRNRFKDERRKGSVDMRAFDWVCREILRNFFSFFNECIRNFQVSSFEREEFEYLRIE